MDDSLFDPFLLLETQQHNPSLSSSFGYSQIHLCSVNLYQGQDGKGWAMVPESRVKCEGFSAFPSDSVVKNLPAVQEAQETRVRSLGWKDPLEEGIATHSSILAWRIQWTEEPGEL